MCLARANKTPEHPAKAGELPPLPKRTLRAIIRRWSTPAPVLARKIIRDRVAAGFEPNGSWPRMPEFASKRSAGSKPASTPWRVLP